VARTARIFFIVAFGDGKETQTMFTLLQTLPSSLPTLPQDASWVAGWGTLSLVNAGLAQAKQRSGLLWWVFSLVLGPVATFLVVVLPKVDRRPTEA
jgi:hypothetical protein